MQCAICVCLRELQGSDELTWLLINGENSSSGAVHAKQCTSSNNRPPPTPALHSHPPVREREREKISDKQNIALKIQPMIGKIIAGLKIAVQVWDEEVQASNNSTWFTNNLALFKSKHRDLRLNSHGRRPRDIY